MELLQEAAATYGMVRQFPAALKLFDRVLDITPNDPGVIASKAGIYQTEGNLQEAARFLPEINSQTFSSYAFYAKIDQLRLERNYSEAIRLLQVRLAQFHYDSQDSKSFDQVGLACSVLAHESVDFAFREIKVYIIKNSDYVEGLADILQM